MTLVHMGDREADIYDLFVLPRPMNHELLIRADHNRKVKHELGYLIPTIEQAPVLGDCTVEIPRNPDRLSRIATLTVRAMAVTLEVRRHHKQGQHCAPVKLNALLVEESTPPPEGKPIQWWWLTTLPIEHFEQAWQVVHWYRLHWLIERFHYTLKHGCRLEQLQLERKERLVKALATYSIVAWRLMSLIYCAHIHPDQSCQTIFQPGEWRLLPRKFEPMNRSKQPPTLHQVVVWIARLSGFLARKGDGEPGVKTLWRGLGKLHQLLEGAQLAAKT